MKLAGRTALVTGAQQGIGAAIALALAGEGADVAVAWHDDKPAAEAVARGVRERGHRALLVQADVARLDEIETMVSETVRQLGVPDILVNNAGVYPRVPFLEMRERDWDYVLDINLKAGCFATIEAAKAMISAKKPGAVINLASTAIRGAIRGVHYSASKGGVVSMTRALALELAPHGIRVNAIAPGLTDTAQPRYGNTDAELIDMARTTIPLGGRLLTPEQIARTAVFLASEDSNASAPDLLDRVLAGELSAHAAMLAAGFRKRRRLEG